MSAGLEECEEDWSCDEWSECMDGRQIRSCSDLNKCNTTKNKPTEEQSCEMGVTGEEEVPEGNMTIPKEESPTMPTGLAVLVPIATHPVTIIILLILIAVSIMYWKKIFVFKKKQN